MLLALVAQAALALHSPFALVHPACVSPHCRFGVPKEGVMVQALDVSFNQLPCAALQVLSNLPMLGSLNITGNKLESLTALRRMTALTALDATQNGLRSLRGLSACTALQQLRASSNQLTTLNGLGVCSSLSEVQVRIRSSTCWLSGNADH